MRIIACMSGTSLDGLDIAFCEFNTSSNSINYDIINAITFKYTDEWENKLRTAPKLSGLELKLLDNAYGLLIAEYINIFIKKNKLSNIDYISSHGHTVFHQTEKNITLQIGDALSIASSTNIPVINDFRSLDVCLNGQGAPLVPIGDQLLFSEYHYCLNLGGFSNVSFSQDTKRIAFDIAPVNLILNYYSRVLGFDFDNDGKIGAKGELIPSLLLELNEIEYYKKTAPKSLGAEWLDRNFFPLIQKHYKVEDILRTLYEHIAVQIGNVLCKKNSQTLVTGGGAFNSFLIQRIKVYSKSEIILPKKELIDFKEALIFGLLAYLRASNKINVLKSVTGAKRDSCSGNIILP